GEVPHGVPRGDDNAKSATDVRRGNEAWTSRDVHVLRVVLTHRRRRSVYLYAGEQRLRHIGIREVDQRMGAGGGVLLGPAAEIERLTRRVVGDDVVGPA